MITIKSAHGDICLYTKRNLKKHPLRKVKRVVDHSPISISHKQGILEGYLQEQACMANGLDMLYTRGILRMTKSGEVEINPQKEKEILDSITCVTWEPV